MPDVVGTLTKLGGLVPGVAPGTAGNVMTSNGTTWTSAAQGSAGDTGPYNPRMIEVYKNPAGTGVIVAGPIAIPTYTATISTADDADGPWLNHATSAVINNVSGVISAGTPAFVQLRADWNPSYEVTFKSDPANITSVRYLVGCWSASPDAVPTPATLHGFWFRYDTSVDGTAFWRTCTAAGAAPTVTTTSVAIAANTKYLLSVQCAAGSIKFYINGVLASTHTATLPTTTSLGFGARVTTLVAGARNMKWGRITMRHI